MQKKSLLDIYRVLTRSGIDYGVMVYRAAAKSILENLHRTQSRALKHSIGAVKTTPTNWKLTNYLSNLSLAHWVMLRGSGEELPATKVLLKV